MAWEKTREKAAKSKAVYNSRTYRVRREMLFRTITPASRCAAPGCGKLLHEHEPHRNGKPPRWQCAHTVPLDNSAPLHLWASVCNLKEAAQRGHREAWGQYKQGNARRRWENGYRDSPNA